MNSITGISSVVGLKELKTTTASLFNDAFFQTIIDNVDTTLSGVRIRKETPGEGPGFTYEARSYLPPWTGDIFFHTYADDYREVANGITFGPYVNQSIFAWNPPNPDGSGGTFSDDGLKKAIYGQRAYHLGTRCSTNAIDCTNTIPQIFLNKFDNRGRLLDLNGTRSTDLRGGTFSWFIQPKTLQEYQTKKTGLAGFSPLSSVNWTNPRNKLLNVLATSDTLDTTPIRNDIQNLSLSLRYNTEILKQQTGDSIGFTLSDIRVLNKDLLDNIKIIGNMVADRTPMIRPVNDVSSSTSQTWFLSTSEKYGFNLGGICLYNQPIGQTNDWNNSTGTSLINTWSLAGITAHQGYYLYEGWHNSGMLRFFHNIFGITSDSEVNTTEDPELVSLLIKVRKLMWSEIFSRVYQTRECRPWFIDWRFAFNGTQYSPRSEIPENLLDSTKYKGRDAGQFKNDNDTWGHLNNQCLTPMTWTGLMAMFLYQYATTSKEKKAALKVYNMVSEMLASYIVKSTRDETDKKGYEESTFEQYNPIGGWLEGRAYAEQSQKDVCAFLYAASKIGDYRLWNLNNGAGGNWIDNQWKYFYYTNLPNNLHVNSQSCPSSNFDINSWNIQTTASNQAAILCSRSPEPGTTGSAIAEHYRYFLQPYDAVSQIIGYKIWKYATGITYAKQMPNWAYISQEKMMVWHSEIPLPFDQSNFYPYSTTRNVTKPFIFSVWTKAHGSYETKAHRDGGHISVYMGDTPVLIETGEVRAYTNSFPDEFIARCVGAAGHNTMQLGQREPAGWGREGEVIAYSGNTFEGSFSMNITNQYNRRGLTAGLCAPSGPFNGNGSGTVFYTYQIANCTRDISWVYDKPNKQAQIIINDVVGISGISSGATPIDQRIYYRYHTGYNKFGIIGHGISTNGYDDIGESEGHGFTFYPKTAGHTTWEIGWNSKGITMYNLGVDWVGVTMTIEGNKSLWLSKEIYSSGSFKNSPDRGLTAEQQKHYALNIGISGPESDGYNLELTTTIDCKGNESL